MVCRNHTKQICTIHQTYFFVIPIFCLKMLQIADHFSYCVIFLFPLRPPFFGSFLYPAFKQMIESYGEIDAKQTSASTQVLEIHTGSKGDMYRLATGLTSLRLLDGLRLVNNWLWKYIIDGPLMPDTFSKKTEDGQRKSEGEEWKKRQRNKLIENFKNDCSDPREVKPQKWRETEEKDTQQVGEYAYEKISH